jgi:hypothetical protein
MSAQDNTFQWDPASAARKLASGVTADVRVPLGTPSANIGSIGKTFQVTPPNNDKRDAYRNCARCGRHINYHVGGKCN